MSKFMRVFTAIFLALVFISSVAEARKRRRRPPPPPPPAAATPAPAPKGPAGPRRGPRPQPAPAKKDCPPGEELKKIPSAKEGEEEEACMPNEAVQAEKNRNIIALLSGEIEKKAEVKAGSKLDGLLTEIYIIFGFVILLLCGIFTFFFRKLKGKLDETEGKADKAFTFGKELKGTLDQAGREAEDPGNSPPGMT